MRGHGGMETATTAVVRMDQRGRSVPGGPLSRTPGGLVGDPCSARRRHCAVHRGEWRSVRSFERGGADHRCGTHYVSCSNDPSAQSRGCRGDRTDRAHHDAHDEAVDFQRSFHPPDQTQEDGTQDGQGPNGKGEAPAVNATHHSRVTMRCRRGSCGDPAIGHHDEAARCPSCPT